MFLCPFSEQGPLNLCLIPPCSEKIREQRSAFARQQALLPLEVMVQNRVIQRITVTGHRSCARLSSGKHKP